MSSFNLRGRAIGIPSNMGLIPEVQILLPWFDGVTDVVRRINMFLDSYLANNIRNVYHLMVIFPTTVCGNAYDRYYSLKCEIRMLKLV